MDEKRVQVLTGASNQSTSIMARNYARHSRHSVSVDQIKTWKFDASNPPDVIIYITVAWIRGVYPFMAEHPEIKYFMSVQDIAGYRKGIWFKKTNNELLEKLSGLLIVGEHLIDVCRKYTDNVKLFNCEVGVDLDLFKRKPKPETFVVGISEKLRKCQMNIYERFLKYPYEKRTSCIGIGTGRPYTDMPAFYEGISTLIDPTNDPRPGGMMFLEAGAVGRPSIAMKRGILAKWFPEELLAKDDDEVVSLLHRLHDDQRFYDWAADEWYNVALSRSYEVFAREWDDAIDSAY